MQQTNNTILVAIPCYNEELSIGKVVDDFKREVPSAEILVVDNNSKDNTACVAREHGAQVVCEKRQGKGFAVQRIFDECKADILVLVDGDDTYSAADIHKLITPVIQGEADMVVGNRIHNSNAKTFTSSHWWGNKFLTTTLNLIFQTKLQDMESGFRAICKKYVDSSALLAGGFGIEPELTIQAIEKGFKIAEVPISLQLRQEGSHSKLNAFRDGTIVLYTIVSLFRDYKPLQFFTLISGALFVLGIGLGWYSIQNYLHTGIVDKIPSLIVASFLILSSFTSFIAGLILSSIKRRHEELLVILRRKSNAN